MLVRFYGIEYRFSFGWDQERDARQIYDLFVYGDPSLVGPVVVGAEGFYLGPWYTWLLAPFYLVVGLHPWGALLFVLTYNVVYICVAFYIVQRVFKRQDYAWFFLTFWAFTFLLAHYDSVSWNPLLVPLGVVIAIGMTYEIYTRATRWKWGILGLVLSLFLHIHFQFIFVGLFCVLLLGMHYYLNRKKQTIGWYDLGVFFAGFAFPFFPLVLFDLRHDFVNTGLFIRFFLERTSEDASVLFSLVPVWMNVFQPFTYIKNPVLMMLAYGVILGFMTHLSMKKKGYYALFYRATLVIFLITPIVFSLYERRPSEYYFMYLYPFVFLTIVDYVLTHTSKWALYVLVFLFIGINTPHIIKQWQPSYTSLYYKEQTVKHVAERVDEDQAYTIFFDTRIGDDAGFRYLIDWYKIPLSQDEKNVAEIHIPPSMERTECTLINELISVCVYF